MLWMVGVAGWNNGDYVWIPNILENFDGWSQNHRSWAPRPEGPRTHIWPSFISCCDVSQPREEKLHFVLTIPGDSPPWQGRQGDRKLKQLVTSHQHMHTCAQGPLATPRRLRTPFPGKLTWEEPAHREQHRGYAVHCGEEDTLAGDRCTWSHGAWQAGRRGVNAGTQLPPSIYADQPFPAQTAVPPAISMVFHSLST